MNWPTLACVATTAVALGLAVVAHRRRLPVHRFVSLVCAVDGLFLTALTVEAERSGGLRALASQAGTPAWYAAALVLCLVGTCVVVALVPWLMRGRR